MEMVSTPSSTAPPLLRVSRPVSACSRCRNAKIKCDGKLPACTACEKAGKPQECTSGADQFARGKERSYMASLEAKLERLEKRLAELDCQGAEAGPVEGDDPNNGSNLVGRAAVAAEKEATEVGKLTSKADQPTIAGACIVLAQNDTAHEPPLSAAAIKKIRKKQQQEDDGEIEELVADIGYMAINAVTRDFYGFANDISFGHIALKASSVSGALDSKPRARLPPRHTATQLVQHYFDKIFTTLPCLNESSFFGAVESVYRDESAASQFDIFCVYMVLAVGTMSLSRSQNSMAAHNAACFVKSALAYTDAVITPSDIKGVQATLLLVQYSMLEPAHFNSWYLIGVASRIMIDIGLHQEPLRASKRKATEMDLRRRVFYCVYTLDRSISMVLQRPFTFSDDSVLVSLPKVEDTTIATSISARGTLTPMSAAVHLFKLRKLQSDWYQQLHLSGDDLLPSPHIYIQTHTSHLEQWRASIPQTMTSSTRDWLLLEWHYLHIYVAAPSPKIPRLSEASTVQIYNHCVSYSIVFRDILCDSQKTLFVYTYHDALRTYFVGSSLLHALYTSEHTLLPPSTGENDLTRTAEAINAVIFILTSMIVRWPDSAALRDKYRSEAAFVLGRIQQRLDVFSAAEQREREREREKEKEKRKRLLRKQMSLEWPHLQQQRLHHQQHHHPYHHTNPPPTAAPGVTMAMQSGGPRLASTASASLSSSQLPMAATTTAGAAIGMSFPMSGHVSTADFGNVAFYRY